MLSFRLFFAKTSSQAKPISLWVVHIPMYNPLREAFSHVLNDFDRIALMDQRFHNIRIIAIITFLIFNHFHQALSQLTPHLIASCNGTGDALLVRTLMRIIEADQRIVLGTLFSIFFIAWHTKR